MSACVSAPSTSTTTPTITVEEIKPVQSPVIVTLPTAPKSTPIPLPTPTPTLVSPVGFVVLETPFEEGDNLALQAGSVITLTWPEAPSGAELYEFVVQSPNKDEDSQWVIGSDTDESDGVVIVWELSPQARGELRAVAHFSGGREVYSGNSGEIYMGQVPPPGQCSLSVQQEPITVLYEPDLESKKIGPILPGRYAEVLGINSENWYQVKVGEWLQSEEDNMPEIGWILKHPGILLYGNCDSILRE